MIKGFLAQFTAKDLVENLRGIKNVVILLFCIFNVPVYVNNILYGDSINKYILNNKMLVQFKSSPAFIYAVLIPILTLISYLILKVISDGILYLTLFRLFECIEKKQHKSRRIIKQIFGCIYSVPKAVVYVIVVCSLIYTISFKNQESNYTEAIGSSKIYIKVKDSIISPVVNKYNVSNFFDLVNNAFYRMSKKGEISYIPTNAVVYYNGVTIKEGMRGNKDIEIMVGNVCKGLESDKEKAKAIYDWINCEIEYDLNKAQQITEGNFKGESGAISAYDSRKGVCFDFACLFGTMGIYAGLNTRVVSGKGFDGTNWVNHSWNQVYLKEECKWINVDVTFSNAGNYFDSILFDLDHKDAEIIGEWIRK